MRKIILCVAAVAVCLGIAGAGLSVPVVASGGSFQGGFQGGIKGGTTAAQGSGMKGGDTSITSIIKNIINIVLYAAGVLAVGYLVFGGIKYITSAGDSSKVKAAKDTILYAVIGLAVTILAYVIVGFVMDALGGGSSDSGGGGGGGSEVKENFVPYPGGGGRFDVSE